MSDQATRKLVAAILAQQVETGQHGEIAQQRLREALTTGPALTEEERSILMLSPVVRDDWRRIRKEVADELREHWAARKIDPVLVPLAAATEDDASPIVLKGEGFSVVLYQQDEEGRSWVILVELGALLENSLDPMTKLLLRDEGGLEWMRGRPDSGGEMTALWAGETENPVTRARQHRLVLEPA